jgi:hypothetical protein
MTHLLITSYDVAKKITKYQEHATQEGANTHKASVLPSYPAAFVCEAPVGFSTRTYKVNNTNDGVVVDQAVVDADTAAATAQAAEASRIAAFKDDASCIDTLDKINTLTFAQFDAWFDANVTNLTQARAALKRLCWVVILLVKRKI